MKHLTSLPTYPHTQPCDCAECKPVSEYEQQAQSFLDKFGIKFRATLSDSKPCPWHGQQTNYARGIAAEPHHYRVTLSKHGTVHNGKAVVWQTPKRLTFDFWDSVHDAQAGIKTVTPYDVLACIGSDASCPGSFEDFCSEFGYEQDSIKALQTYRRCSAFAKRLQAFFTKDELEALREIQ